MTAQSVHKFRSFAELHAHLGAMVDGEIAPIPGLPDEAYIIENGQPRRIKACMIPEGHLEQLTALADAEADAHLLSCLPKGSSLLPTQGSQRMLVNATAAKALEQGYDSEEDFARAEASQHAADERQRRKDSAMWKAGEGKLQRREFSPSQMIEHPSELIVASELRERLRAGMSAMVNVADYDPACEIVHLKMWDGMAYMAERAATNVIAEAERTKKELNSLQRRDDGGEIHSYQTDRLVERLKGLKVQYYHFSQMLKVALDQRTKAVAISGINWPEYKSLKDRAELGAQAHRQKQRNRVSSSDYLLSLSDSQLGEWQRSHDAFYRPQRNGIDAADAHSQPMLDAS